MNDSAEYTYSLQVIMDVIKEIYDFVEDENFLKIFPNNTDTEPIFTFSLSENGDLLSQWRGYCPNGGYSISFFNSHNFGQMSRMIKANNLYIGKCLYKEDEINKFVIKKIVELTPEEFKVEKEEKEKSGELKGWIIDFYNNIEKNTLKYAPLIKHPAFKEEQEWRIVANYAESRNIPRFKIVEENTITRKFILREHDPLEDISDKLMFRQGKSFLIPYLEIPLIETETPFYITKEEAKNPVSITDVIVGPTPHEELTIRACEMLLFESNKLLSDKDVDYKKTVVSASKLPYRNW